MGIIRGIVRRTNEYMGAQSLKRLLPPDPCDFGNIRIRPVTIDEIEDIVEIHKISFDTPTPRKKRLLRYSMYYPHFFVAAEIDNIVIGYTIFRIIFSISKKGVKRKAHLLFIAVHPDNRCKNIGSHLLDYSIKTLKGCKISEIFLYVSTENMPALKLYDKLEFKVVKPMKDICGAPDCYLMERFL